MFFGSLLIVFLHDGVLKYMIDEDNETERQKAFMQNVNAEGREFDPSYAGNYQPIKPTLPEVAPKEEVKSSLADYSKEVKGGDEPDDNLTNQINNLMSTKPKAFGGNPFM